MKVGLYVKGPDGDIHIGDYEPPVVPREGEVVIGFDHYWLVISVSHVIQAEVVALMCVEVTDFPDRVPSQYE